MIASQVKLLHFGDNNKGCFDIHINPWIKDTSMGNNNESSTDNTTYPIWMYVPMYKESSMWKVCDTIPSKYSSEKGILSHVGFCTCLGSVGVDRF